MARRYRNSPIVEAVCEFQFEEESPWDLAIPGLVYEKVRSEFPIRRQAQRVIAVNLSISPEEFEPQFRTVSLMQFLRKDEKALVQVGPQLLSVNVFKPYPAWPKFLSAIKKGLNAYREVVAPKGIRRIGLRYINHIEIPEQNVKLEEYFEFRPYVSPSLPQDYGTFVTGINLPYENSRDILNLQLASSPSSSSAEESAAVVLSLDYFLLKTEGVDLDEAFNWVDTAHSHIEDTFEACITQKLRDLFKEVKK